MDAVLGSTEGSGKGTRERVATPARVQPAVIESMTQVGVDDGYAAIKVVYESSGAERRVAVPARIARGLRVQTVGGDSIGAYETDGEKFTVSTRLPAEPTRVGEYHTSPMHRVLVTHALIQAGLEGRCVHVACGLPVQDFFVEGGRNTGLIGRKRSSLESLVAPIGRAAAARIGGVTVYPQAIGAYLASVLTADGQRDGSLDEKRVAILDIGGNTSDIAGVISGESPEIISDFIRSLRLGVFDVRVIVRRLIAHQFSVEIDDDAMDRVLRDRTLDLFGEDVPVEALVTEAVGTVWAQMQGQIEECLGNAASFARLLLVGGGAALFAAHVKSKYRHTVIPEAPEFANATGFYRYRRFVAVA